MSQTGFRGDGNAPPGRSRGFTLCVPLPGDLLKLFFLLTCIQRVGKVLHSLRSDPCARGSFRSPERTTLASAKKKSSFIPRNSTPCYGLDCRVEFPGALRPWSLSPSSWVHKPALLLSSANRLQVGDQQSAPCRGGVRGGQTPHQAAGGIWFPRDVGLLAGGGQLMKAETKTQ